jgi:hypothetical protein
VVPCHEAHLAEVTRVVELGTRFADWPGYAALDAVAATDCAAAMGGYVGGSRRGLVPIASSLQSSPPDWGAGGRRLACAVRGVRLESWIGSLGAANLAA